MSMKNRLFSVIIAIVTGCLPVFVASGGSAGAETVRIKLATLAPEGIERFSVVLSKNTNYEISSYPVNDITLQLYVKKGNTLVTPLNTIINKKKIVAKQYSI